MPLQAITVHKTKDNKVAHLFVDYIDGAISGHAVSFCGLVQWPGSKNDYKNWWFTIDAGRVPLCNHCGRAFHEERKNWKGLP
jgi:hypothetical protein